MPMWRAIVVLAVVTLLPPFILLLLAATPTILEFTWQFVRSFVSA